MLSGKGQMCDGCASQNSCQKEDMCSGKEVEK